MEGPSTKPVFEAYVEQVLAPPSCLPGQVVILDNLAAHKGERVRKLIETRGCGLLFLPSYSPDFNPIEEAFSKIKTLLRATAAGRGAHPHWSHRSNRARAGSGERARRAGLLRPLRLPLVQVTDSGLHCY